MAHKVDESEAEMAKKKHKVAAPDGAKDGAKADDRNAPDAAPAAELPIDVAYRRGNFALVRSLARANTDAHSAQMSERIKLDPQQILIGAATLFVVAFAAFLTLH